MTFLSHKRQFFFIAQRSCLKLLLFIILITLCSSRVLNDILDVSLIPKAICVPHLAT